MNLINFYNEYIVLCQVEQNKIFGYALRNNAKPIIKGEITKGKIRYRGIKLITRHNIYKYESWLEQRGKRISDIFVINYTINLNNYERNKN